MWPKVLPKPVPTLYPEIDCAVDRALLAKHLIVIDFQMASCFQMEMTVAYF